MVAEMIPLRKGPAGHALVDAFKYAYDKTNPHIAEFTTDKGEKIQLLIFSLEHEDGSGRSFLFRGFIVSDSISLDIFKGKKVHGWFNSATQQGWMMAGDPISR